MSQFLAPASGRTKTYTRTIAAAATTVAATLGLGACASGAGAEAGAIQWEEPAWVAEQRAAQDEFYATLDACFFSRGWEFERGTDRAMLLPAGADMDRFWADDRACFEEMGYEYPDEYWMPEDTIRQWFGYEVDRYRCFVAHGVEGLTPPPSEDAFVASVQADFGVPNPQFNHWSPGREVNPGPTLSDAEWEQLYFVDCPTPWIPMPRIGE